MTEKSSLLRNYQQEIIERVHQEWHHHRSVMVQMPTGTGKTHVLASIVSSFSGKVLLVAHRRELIEQIKETVCRFVSLTADSHKFNKRIKVESIQTIYRRMERIDFIPELIVIDEAHHALARTYRVLWEKWPKAKVLGLTATPCRMNHTGFTDLFDALVCSWSIAEFIRKGVLSPFDYVSILPNSMEQRLINSLQKRGADGDYQIKEMGDVLNRLPSIERLHRSIVEFANGKRGIVYAINIDHARNIAAYYNLKGINTVAIDSKTPKEKRREMVEDFKNGRIQVLVNVDVFSEGFDCPDVEFVQMARPTLSLSKYLQQVGRGLRKSKDKASCMLIDNVGLCGVFGLPVKSWDWERMFCGKLAGKGMPTINQEMQVARYGVDLKELRIPNQDCGVGLVISHNTLLEKLCELDVPPTVEEKTPELRSWQDTETGLWGLKRGREKLTTADYVTIFGIKDGWAAVRFRNYECGLVNERGKVIWKRNECTSLRFVRNSFVEIKGENGEMNYLDLCNMSIYLQKPEVKMFGSFELLKVGYTCYSRTQRRYVSQVDYYSLSITNHDFMLKITEKSDEAYCILNGDNDNYYRIYRWLADGSVVVYDEEENFFWITLKGAKNFIANGSEEHWFSCRSAIEKLEIKSFKEMDENEEKKRLLIYEQQEFAVPFQVGLKWGLKVGKHITVPPIYRNIKRPVGKYCAMEMNYNQWGVIAIDGSILIEAKYPEVFINEDNTATLTLVTGKKRIVKLK